MQQKFETKDKLFLITLELNRNVQDIQDKLLMLELPEHDSEAAAKKIKLVRRKMSFSNSDIVMKILTEVNCLSRKRSA